MVDVQRAGADRDRGIGGGHLAGVLPVGSGLQPVKQAGGGQQERADTVTGHHRPAPVSGAQRVNHLAGGLVAEPGPRQHHDQVRVSERVQAMLNLQGQARVGRQRPRPPGADRDVEGRQAGAAGEHPAHHADTQRGHRPRPAPPTGETARATAVFTTGV
jgi:hypothetical protein